MFMCIFMEEFEETECDVIVISFTLDAAVRPSRKTVPF